MGVFYDLYFFNMIKPYTWNTIPLLESWTEWYKNHLGQHLGFEKYSKDV